jgi:hypothetical protein
MTKIRRYLLKLQKPG